MLNSRIDIVKVTYCFYSIHPYIAHAVNVKNDIQSQTFNKSPRSLHNIQYCNCQSNIKFSV